MLNKQVNEVTHNDYMYGCPTKFNRTHPEKLIFVDEVGDNTSQTNDGGVNRNQLRHGKRMASTEAKIHSLTATTSLLDSLPPWDSQSCVPSSLLLIN
jgi:hypothetical protein